MSFLIKLIPAIGVTAVGGGVFAGVTKSSNSSSTTNDTPLTTGSGREETLQAPQSHQQEPEQVVTELQDQQPQESNSVSSVTQEEILRTQESSSQVTQTGNCVVITAPEKVKEQLPKDIVYVAFSCKNTTDKSELKDWKGYFPSNLLVKVPSSFKEGDRVNIDVTDVDDVSQSGEDQLQDDEFATQAEPLWTLFESDQFKVRTITGNYGDSTAKDDIEEGEEDSESEEEVYKVRVPELTDSKGFYLQW